MTYVKKNFHDILKLYINQIGITIFALMLYTACGFTDEYPLFGQLRTIVSVFSILFFFVLLYYVMWEEGAKDKIRVDGGRLDPCPYRGLFNGLLANIPNLVLGIFTLLFSVLSLNGIAWAEAPFSILFLITMSHSAMYMGLIQTSVYGFSPLDAEPTDYGKYLIMSILFLVIPLLSALVTHIAYTLGSKEIKLLGFLFSKKK